MTKPRVRLVALGLAAVLGAAGPYPAGAATRVVITQLDDLRLGVWPGAGDLVAEDDHCVQVLGGKRPRTFSLEAYGPGGGGAFVLLNGADTLDFEVAYDDGTGFRTFPRAGTMLSGLVGSETPGQARDCELGDPSQRRRLRVRIQEPDLTAAPAGTFSGPILLMVVPE